MELKEFLIERINDESRLPQEYVNLLKRLVNYGAKSTVKWDNALKLVDKAYKVANIEKPEPSMKAAWSQYEEIIGYAVTKLAQYRGVVGEWRLSDDLIG
jgi:hypothetical protein